MILVHHLNNSRSQRILWLLEELGLEYELVHYKRDAVTMLAPPELRAVHPLGKSPVISDGDIVVAESGAIIEYLTEKAGQLVPPAGTENKRRYTYFLHFAEGSGMPPLLMKLVFEKLKSAPVPFFVKPIARGIANKVLSTFVHPNIDNNLRFLEAELGARDWFAGDAFSAADIQMSFVVEAAASRGALERFPKLQAWLKRIHARPAYKRALKRGGPYELLR